MARARYHHGDLETTLLDLAMQAVQARGAESVSLRKLAKEAGVNPAAAYRHFADKQALMVGVAKRGVVMLAATLGAATDPDPVRWVANVGRAYVGFAIEHPHLYRLMWGPQMAGISLLPTNGPAASDPLKDALRANGPALAVPVEHAVAPLWAAVHGIALLIIDGRADCTPERAMELTLANALAGLGLIPAGSPAP